METPLMSGYAMFLDDERQPPGPGRKRADGLWWIVARSSSEAMAIIDRLGWPAFVSLDHDLCGEDTAMLFLHRVTDRLLSEGQGRGQPLPFRWTVHSQNPIGRNNIEGLLNGYAVQAEAASGGPVHLLHEAALLAVIRGLLDKPAENPEKTDVASQSSAPKVDLRGQMSLFF